LKKKKKQWVPTMFIVPYQISWIFFSLRPWFIKYVCCYLFFV
jgi:hypothetical protein